LKIEKRNEKKRTKKKGKNREKWKNQIRKRETSNSQILWKLTMTLQIFYGNRPKLSRFFPGMNLKFPDFFWE